MQNSAEPPREGQANSARIGDWPSPRASRPQPDWHLPTALAGIDFRFWDLALMREAVDRSEFDSLSEVGRAALKTWAEEYEIRRGSRRTWAPLWSDRRPS